MQRIRNPSPPPDFTDYRCNMHIEFLKPLFSVQSIDLSLDLFNKALFISPPKITPEVTPETVASYDLEIPPAPKNLQLIPDPDIYEDTTNESSHVEEPERGHKNKSSKKHKSVKKEPISSDDQRRHRKREKSRHKSSRHKIHSEYTIDSDSDKVPDADIYEDTTEPYPKTNESSHVKEPERAHKHRSSKKHRSVKKEPISSDDQRRHRKRESSRHKSSRHKYYPEYTIDSDSDEVPKAEKRHKSHSHYRNVSESDSSDYYEKDSRKRRHKKKHAPKEYSYSESSTESYSKELRDYKRSKEYKIGHVSDSDRSVETDRHHKRHRDHRKRYDAYDSDRSRGSVEEDWHYKPSSKKGSVSSNSDRSDSKPEGYKVRFKQELVEDSNLSEVKFDPKMEIKEEYDEIMNHGPDSFYCKVCQIHLNSLATYESHMNGKKHKKKENSQMVPEILKGSVSTLTSTKELMRPSIATQSNKVVLNEESYMQRCLADYTENPIIGLNYIQERRNDGDTVYYCELCDAPCQTPSLIPHLVGYKHQLKFLKRENPYLYNRVKEVPKKQVAEEVRHELFRHERKYGRGNITVVSMIKADQTPMQPEAGPSWRNPVPMQPQNEVDMLSVLEVPFPDFETTKNDYYCKICDAHMNNFQMFESHRRGKRHLKNEKKTAAERRALQMDSRAPPGTASKLEEIISRNDHDVFVGLNYIRETLTSHGAQYLCYLCGSSGCDTVMIDHLLSLKHRVKYLETVHENGLIPNAIYDISELEVSSHNRETLVLEECERIARRYGKGSVEIYIQKGADYI